MRFLRLFAVFSRVSLMDELAYRVDFFVQFFQSLLELATAIAGLAVIFSPTHTLGCWRPDEVLGLVGVYILVGGMIRFTIQPGMERLITSVRKGTLDFFLTKPEDARLLVSVQRMRIREIVVLHHAHRRNDDRLQLLAHPRRALLLAREGGEHPHDLPGHVRGGPLVRNALSPRLRFVLTFLVTVAFVVAVPAEALPGRLTLPTAMLAVALASVLFAISRALWKTGLKSYTGAPA